MLCCFPFASYTGSAYSIDLAFLFSGDSEWVLYNLVMKYNCKWTVAVICIFCKPHFFNFASLFLHFSESHFSPSSWGCLYLFSLFFFIKRCELLWKFFSALPHHVHHSLSPQRVFNWYTLHLVLAKRLRSDITIMSIFSCYVKKPHTFCNELVWVICLVAFLFWAT